MPSLSPSKFAKYVQRADLKELFNEMGWNNDNTPYSVTIENQAHVVRAVAQKEGFKVIVCTLTHIPDHATRRAIARQLTKQSFHHLLIFVDGSHNQHWLIQQRSADKPDRILEVSWYAGQATEALYQRARGLFFNLDEEGNITIVDVINRVSGELGANSEKVTKKFYDRFKKEHVQFKGAITNISSDQDTDWYASLMLNRLMFCYFIQKKRFLDDNPNYLADKLKASASKRGTNEFYSFYRNFLLVLFHDGLGGRSSREQVQTELGRIPYLNGGLFDVHEIEKKYPDITINDAAFVQIFAFFDEYEWHLDTSPDASGREINPDVIGYIFEKYINDRAKMGAYYTKEDITEYISKNCIIPFLFDATARATDSTIWDEAWELLRTSGDTYIYPAVKHGCALDLPADIATGTTNVAERNEWNKPAPATHANPTEIWREVVARRQRYTELRAHIDSGNIRQINDLITYNLNIRQFCQDVLAQSTNPHLIKACYGVLTQLTVLDPTCGSGAFLFAALNILEPLYAECLNRMELFAAESDATQDTFGSVLAEMRSSNHPNIQYFIFKSIILNNLYGVDIMKEATEVAKLRLFLKLVASVDADKRKPNLGIEPLPDIDFNIRAGNALVGFATKQALDDALITTMDGKIMSDNINALSAKVAQDFEEYRALQLGTTKYELMARTKKNLKDSLAQINEQLNQLLHQTQTGVPFAHWYDSHKPFHWFAEFYEIIVGHGGFDVIIGNPPYVEYAKVKNQYKLENFTTILTGNIYAQVLENSFHLHNKSGYVGFIVPVSAVCTDRTKSLQEFLRNKYTRFISSFDVFPQRLFTGAAQRLAILLLVPPNSRILYTSRYHRWLQEERSSLMNSIAYSSNELDLPTWTPRVYNRVDISILSKLNKNTPFGTYLSTIETHPIFVHRIINNFVKALDFEPFFQKSSGEVTHSDDYKTYYINPKFMSLAISVLNSNIFYWYWRIHGDGFHCGAKDIAKFPITINNIPLNAIQELNTLCKQLMDDLNNNSSVRTRDQKTTGTIRLQTFFVGKSKPIIDEIDRVLAQHYGFSDEELDYIINYDIKYRMGRAGADGADGGDGDDGDGEGNS